MNAATGAAIALASFNDRDYKHLVSDSVVIAAANSGFSLFGGFVVFAVVGNLAHEENKPVSQVAEEGPGCHLSLQKFCTIRPVDIKTCDAKTFCRSRDGEDKG